MIVKPIFTQAPEEQRKNGLIRIGLSIAVIPDKKEERLFDEAFFIPTKGPVPVKLFQHANRGVITSSTQKELIYKSKTQRVRGFVKNGICVDSYLPGVQLNVGAPGEVLYGYFNPEDDSRVTVWINEEIALIATEITRRVVGETENLRERNIRSREVNINLNDDRARQIASGINVGFERIATNSRLIRKI